MKLFKNNISLLHPDTLFLCACSNEDRTDDDIMVMGQRLANEVKGYINEWVPEKGLGRLSFVGHSMGGLIIRAALPYLEEYS
jgi:pimeloyl-ACP methyl ester carboxylesterase